MWRNVLQAEQRDYDQIAGVISSVAQLQQAADQKKAAAALKDEEQQKKLLELQKKRDKALKDYIDSINKAFNEMQLMNKQDEDNILDSIAAIEKRDGAQKKTLKR